MLLTIEEQRLTNLRIVCHDAVVVLEEQIALNCLDEVLILFPDPWPKKRHHKRRLIQSEFVAVLADRLQGDGVVRLATDWQPYAEQMLEVLDAVPTLANLAAPGASCRDRRSARGPVSRRAASVWGTRCGISPIAAVRQKDGRAAVFLETAVQTVDDELHRKRPQNHARKAICHIGTRDAEHPLQGLGEPHHGEGDRKHERGSNE